MNAFHLWWTLTMVKLWCFDTRSFATMFSFFRYMRHFAFLYTTASYYRILRVFITRFDLYDFTTIPCASWFAWASCSRGKAHPTSSRKQKREKSQSEISGRRMGSKSKICPVDLRGNENSRKSLMVTKEVYLQY